MPMGFTIINTRASWCRGSALPPPDAFMLAGKTGTLDAGAVESNIQQSGSIFADYARPAAPVSKKLRTAAGLMDVLLP